MERVPLSGAAVTPGEPDEMRHLQLESVLDKDYPVQDFADRCWKVSESYVKVSIGLALGVALTLAVVLSVVLKPQQTSNTYRIPFLVVGDWGRQGDYNQSAVADLMAARAATLSPEFVISTGDNFYPHGLNSTQDVLFDESFAQLYSHEALQVPWHAVLGNHDYGDGEYENGEASCLDDRAPCHVSPMHQLGGALILRDPRWHCERQYVLTLGGGQVQVFFLDTTPFVEKYWNSKKYPWAQYAGGVLKQSWEAQLLEFEGQLAASTAPWKLVVGHHPPHSNGKHGDTEELIQHVEPLLKQYGVQAWFSGHDHSLEHLYVPDAGYHVIVSGAGSKCDRGFKTTRLSKFQWESSGFVAAALTQDELRVEFYHLENDGAAAYTAIIPRQSQL